MKKRWEDAAWFVCEFLRLVQAQASLRWTKLPHPDITWCAAHLQLTKGHWILSLTRERASSVCCSSLVFVITEEHWCWWTKSSITHALLNSKQSIMGWVPWKLASLCFWYSEDTVSTKDSNFSLLPSPSTVLQCVKLFLCFGSVPSLWAGSRQVLVTHPTSGNESRSSTRRVSHVMLTVSPIFFLSLFIWQFFF